MEKRDKVIELIDKAIYETNDVEGIADEICSLFNVVGQSEQFYCFDDIPNEQERCKEQCNRCKKA